MSTALSQPENLLPLLASLEAGLEKFLDVLGEIRTLEEAPAPALRPDEAGFALTFPYESATGVFLLAERGGILPVWYQNPGLAGLSRLELLRRGLMTLFAPNETVPETPADFFTSANSFCGRITELEQVLAALQALPNAHTQAFQIRRFDGQTGFAWMTAPVPDVEILRQHAWQSAPDVEVLRVLKPLRALDGNYQTTENLRQAGGILPEVHSPEKSDSLPETSTESSQLEKSVAVSEPAVSDPVAVSSNSTVTDAAAPMADVASPMTDVASPMADATSTVISRESHLAENEPQSVPLVPPVPLVSPVEDSAPVLEAIPADSSMLEPASEVVPADSQASEPASEVVLSDSPMSEPAPEVVSDSPVAPDPVAIPRSVAPQANPTQTVPIPALETALVEDYVETIEVPGGVYVEMTYRPEDLLVEGLYTTVCLHEVPDLPAEKPTVQANAVVEIPAVVESNGMKFAETNESDGTSSSLEDRGANGGNRTNSDSDANSDSGTIESSGTAESSGSNERRADETGVTDGTEGKGLTNEAEPVSPRDKVVDDHAKPTDHSKPTDLSAARILDISVTFSARLSGQTLPIRQILSLKQGDILQLPHPETAPLSMYLDEQRIGEAVPVEYDDCLAVQALTCELRKTVSRR